MVQDSTCASDSTIGTVRIFEETQKCKTVGQRKNGELQDGLE